MTAHPTPIDISTMPDLVRLTKEVEARQTSLELTRENKIVAVLMPPPTATSKKTSIEEALALAGAWGDLPSDDIEEQLDRIRHASTPTPSITFDFE